MKTEDIYLDIVRQLTEGVWAVGDQLPTERALAEHYGVSRPTVSRVLNRLRDSGQIRRTVGAGSFLTEAPRPLVNTQRNIGLFIPGLGKGEIFEPICARIAELSQHYNFNLIWGSMPAHEADDHDEKLVQAAQRFIDQGVQGVFFQPIERESGAENKNLKIAAMFEQAAIPLVLLDGDYLAYPKRSAHDLVGIDNIAASYQLCEHFIKQGATRVDFLWQPNTAGTYIQRLIGYREALFRAGITPNRSFEHEGDPRDKAFVRTLVDAGVSNLICANDETAALFMHELDNLGLEAPKDMRIAGFDDVKYAHLARVPLTTMRQPCRTLGELALSTLIERIKNPNLPPRNITARALLCVRESSQLT